MAFEVSPIFIVQTIVGIIGMLGNALVCLVIWRDRAMHTLTNAFIFNQATVDFLGSVVMLLSSVIPTPSPLPPGAGGLLLCKIWVSNYFLWAFYVVSSFNLVALTFERYLAIVYPFKFQSMCTRLGATVVIISVWVAGFAVAIYATELYRFNVDRCDRYFDFKLQVIGIMVPGLQFFIPVASMLFAYIHIMVELKRSADRQGNMRTVSGPSNPAHESADESLLRARRNTFKTLVIVFAAFVCCWSLNASLLLGANLGNPFDDASPEYIFSVALVAANSAVNPFIYAFKYKQFKAGFRKLFCKHRSATIQPEASLNSVRTRSTNVTV
ncbi:kappa-type opioid receptor-like [Patiria miniata]|uniref:G-protein coupled receptors family 1 profile domain-containing protein n=1 Tax=Patiria miniata TaxID=46514 RepID=A0A914A833_PATMI|nr:kappa-type opioid receptor-like [Patiria miniata]